MSCFSRACLRAVARCTAALLHAVILAAGFFWCGQVSTAYLQAYVLFGMADRRLQLGSRCVGPVRKLHVSFILGHVVVDYV
jgi:hypothetical protein